MADALIGQQVGNYVVLRRVGQGGMGEVYAAEHPQIGRQVAIKVLSGDLAATGQLAERFRTEARAVTRVAHRNVIQIFDFGKLADGRLYYTMELLQGRDLGRVLQSCGKMTPATVQPYLEQICAGLQAVHDCGVIHRDLKPENIFVVDGPQLELKLLDFGIAKLQESTQSTGLTATGMIMGTALCIAPEQAAGEPARIGPQTDLYALGVMLFWMLSGRPPFLDEPTAVLLAKHIKEPPPPLRSIEPSVPPAVALVVERCLQKRPQDRYGSAAELAVAFSAAMLGAAPTLAAPILSPLHAPTVAASSSAMLGAAPTLAAPISAVDHPSLALAPSSLDGALAATAPQLVSVTPARRLGLRLAMAVAALALLGGGVAVFWHRPSEAPKTQPIATRPATTHGVCDGAEARRPCLAPADVGFTDPRGGAGWGDRCVLRMRRGQLGWAKAACARGLTLKPAAQVRGALLYNLGLIAEWSSDLDEAKSRYRQSLAIRPNAAVQKALDKLAGGQPAAAEEASARLLPADASGLYSSSLSGDAASAADIAQLAAFFDGDQAFIHYWHQYPGGGDVNTCDVTGRYVAAKSKLPERAYTVVKQGPDTDGLLVRVSAAGIKLEIDEDAPPACGAAWPGATFKAQDLEQRPLECLVSTARAFFYSDVDAPTRQYLVRGDKVATLPTIGELSERYKEYVVVRYRGAKGATLDLLKAADIVCPSKGK